MQKRSLGRSGIEVPPIIFGGNVFGWTADKATSFRLLDALLDEQGAGLQVGQVELELLVLVGRVQRRRGRATGDRNEARRHLRPVRQHDGDPVAAGHAMSLHGLRQAAGVAPLGRGLRDLLRQTRDRRRELRERGRLDGTLEQIRELLETSVGLRLEELCDRLLAVLPSALDDDVALLAVRSRG